MHIQIIQIVAKDNTQGFGRNLEEAHANSGLSDEALRTAAVTEVQISDDPHAGDNLSQVAANTVCRFHVESDDEVPKQVRNKLRELLSANQFASALQYCFEMIWDRGFETDLSQETRKYRP